MTLKKEEIQEAIHTDKLFTCQWMHIRDNLEVTK